MDAHDGKPNDETLDVGIQSLFDVGLGTFIIPHLNLLEVKLLH